MPKKKELKTIDIHKDYLLWNLIGSTKTAAGITCNRMQERTPYGPEYEAAFSQYKKIIREIQKWEDLLATCVNMEEYKGDK